MMSAIGSRLPSSSGFHAPARHRRALPGRAVRLFLNATPRFCARSAISRLLSCRDDDVFRKGRSEEHTSELQSRGHLVCRLLLEKKNITYTNHDTLKRLS